MNSTMNTNKTVRYGTYRFTELGGFVRVTVGNALDGSLYPTRILSGLTAKEIVELDTKVGSAHGELNRRFEALKREYPGLSFGYLGNCSSLMDDRSWYVFLPHPGRVGESGDRVGGYRTWELPDMVAAWEAVVSTVRVRMVGR